MTKKVLFLFAFLMLASSMAFAQTPGDAAAASHQWIQLSSGFGMAIASGLCAIGQGAAIRGACEAMGRNPAAANVIRLTMLLGLVFIESLALYTLVIIFIKVV